MDERVIGEGETPWGSYVFTFRTDSPRTKLGAHAIQIPKQRRGARADMLREATKLMDEWEASSCL